MLANCRWQFLLDRLRRCLKLFVSTESTSCHEFVSQFGLAIFLYAKNFQKLLRRPSLAQVSVEWTSERPMEKGRNDGHGRSIASDSVSGDNSDHSGDRLSQNGEKQQVKTPTTRVYRPIFMAWKMWFRNYYVPMRLYRVRSTGNLSSVWLFILLTLYISDSVLPTKCHSSVCSDLSDNGSPLEIVLP